MPLLHGKAALKPSLVEWKRGLQDSLEETGKALKPSLVEWKHSGPKVTFPAVGILETFLSGMETRHPYRPRVDLRQPLKPSLVEWKLELQARGITLADALETFLSGMETLFDFLN